MILESFKLEIHLLKEKIKFSGIPNFAPEIFRTVLLKDPLKSKQLEKGLTQLSEEGTVQLFQKKTTNEKILEPLVYSNLK